MTVQIELVPTLGPLAIITHPRNDGLCENCGQDHSIKAVAISKKRLTENTTPSLVDLFWGAEE